MSKSMNNANWDEESLFDEKPETEIPWHNIFKLPIFQLSIYVYPQDNTVLCTDVYLEW
jgi:hypothetical protein